MHKFTAISIFVLLVSTSAISIGEATPTDLVTVSSRHHCCLGSAVTATVPVGASTITYVSGAWNNWYSSGAFLGYVRVEIPELDLAFSLGTEEQVGFGSYAEAEAAASGDSEQVVNATDSPVTAYFHVWDSCNQGGACYDNVGDVVIDISSAAVSNDDSSWSTLKVRY
jgi:hypothetical protein